MSQQSDIHLPQFQALGQTSRTDAWWLSPMLTALTLLAFVVYTTWAAFQGAHYFYDGQGAHYLSPFYSPLLFGAANEPRWFDAVRPEFWPSWLPFSAAFLILIGPAGMRTTCYYYRGAYYKAFWADPINCSVGEPGFRGTKYRGERWLPLILQNAHRYFFYIAVAFVVMLSYDAWCAAWFKDATGVERLGLGVGTLVLVVNAALIGAYTFSCHCARHFVGGNVDRLSEAPIRRHLYKFVSALNARHMLYAWLSLFWVGFADIYVRLLSQGSITDIRLL